MGPYRVTLTEDEIGVVLDALAHLQTYLQEEWDGVKEMARLRAEAKCLLQRLKCVKQQET